MERRSNKLHTCHCWGMKLVSGKIIPRTWFGWKTTNFFFGKSHVLKGDLFYCSCIFSTNSFFKFLKKFVEGVMGGIWRVLKERLWGISLRVFDYSMLRSEGNFRLFFWLRRWGGSFLLFYLFFCRTLSFSVGFSLAEGGSCACGVIVTLEPMVFTVGSGVKVTFGLQQWWH